jgi:hypothetical protein
MTFLRDWWRSTAFCRYFDGLEPIDRYTFWTATALALAIGVSVSAIVHP